MDGIEIEKWTGMIVQNMIYFKICIKTMQIFFKSIFFCSTKLNLAKLKFVKRRCLSFGFLFSTLPFNLSDELDMQENAITGFY